MANAWTICLWALENYREHAQRLAHPVLLPLAKAICELLSRNRFFLSHFCFNRTRRLRLRSWLLITLRIRRIGKAPVAPDENCHPGGQVRSAAFFAEPFPARTMKSLFRLVSPIGRLDGWVLTTPLRTVTKCSRVCPPGEPSPNHPAR